MRSADRIVLSRCAMTKARTAGQHLLETRLDAAFGFGIHRRRRFIHHEDLRLRKHGARKGDQLLLPGRQAHPALADLGIQALLHLRDELVRTCKLSGALPDLGIGGLEPPVADVVGDRARRTGAAPVTRCPSLDLQPMQTAIAVVDTVQQHAARQVGS